MSYAAYPLDVRMNHHEASLELAWLGAGGMSWVMSGCPEVMDPRKPKACWEDLSNCM